MSRWGELIPHDEEAAEEGRCLCGCQDEDTARVMLDNSAAKYTPVEPLKPHYAVEETP